MEQLFNLKFVRAVEKRPVLYNTRMKGYSTRQVTDKTWRDVGKEVDLTASECKEKWKNLRSVYVRNLKPPAGGSNTNRKAYYLAEAMQFIRPFIRTFGGPVEAAFEENITDSEGKLNVKIERDDDEEIFPQSDSDEKFNVETEYVDDEATTPISSPYSSAVSTEREGGTCRLRTATRKSPKRKVSDIDKLNDSNEEIAENRRMFLVSLLPEIEPMTETQMKSFRRRVLRLIDDIINSNGKNS